MEPLLVVCSSDLHLYMMVLGGMTVMLFIIVLATVILLSWYCCRKRYSKAAVGRLDNTNNIEQQIGTGKENPNSSSSSENK